jgi:hypothetical protein
LGVLPSAVVLGRLDDKEEPEPQMGSKALDVIGPDFVAGGPTDTTRDAWSEYEETSSASGRRYKQTSSVSGRIGT